MAEATTDELRDRIVAVGIGQLPWAVFGSNIPELGVWNKYEYPKVGTFSLQDGTKVFFQEVEEIGDLTVWKYTRLDSDMYDQHVLNATFQSVGHMRKWIKENIDQSTEEIWALADDLQVIAIWR
jgi:hypothetical protein